MKPFTTLSVVVFALVAVLQLVRVIAGWPVLIDGFAVPISASVVACAAAAVLSFMLWRESAR